MTRTEGLVFAGLAGALLVVGACGSDKPAPTAGYVVQREHNSAYYGPTTMVCTGWSSSGCSQFIQVPGVFHEEEWRLKLRNEGHQGWRGVSEDTYERCADNEWCVTP